MQNLPGVQSLSPVERALASNYQETFNVASSTITLSYTPQTTVDDKSLIKVYKNGVLMSPSGGGGGTQIRESRALTGTVVNLVSTGPGSATATTGTNHTLLTGNIVAISGAAPGAYDVTAAITFDAVNGFDYPVAGSPTSPATGTIHWLAQSFYLLQKATSGPELVFVNGALRNPSGYTRTDNVTGSLIDLGSPLVFGDVVVIWYTANGGGYTLSGKTLTFDSALTTSDTVVVAYPYRN